MKLVNLFISHLVLESLLGRLNQQLSRIFRNLFIPCLISIHPEIQRGLRNFTLAQYQPRNISIFFGKKIIRLRLEIVLGFFWESIGNFKGARSCGNRSNQALFQNVRKKIFL